MCLETPFNIPSPIQQIYHPDVEVGGCELYIKREDLIHPDFGGNKWRKLKYNLEHFLKVDHSDLVTFGGPFSNHIAATASICKCYGIPCMGIIRGLYKDEKNPTLTKARAEGMRLVHVSKEGYRQKERAPEIAKALGQLLHPMFVPEGGSNAYALLGVAETMAELTAIEKGFDFIVVSAGTGMTAAGLISASTREKVVVVNVLKNASLEKAIHGFLPEPRGNWTIKSDYTFGGFAKVTPELISFINGIKASFGFALDPIYNGKAFFATLDLLKQGYFPQGSRILYVHTGGSQGITAYNYSRRKTGTLLLSV